MVLLCSHRITVNTERDVPLFAYDVMFQRIGRPIQENTVVHSASFAEHHAAFPTHVIWSQIALYILFDRDVLPAGKRRCPPSSHGDTHTDDDLMSLWWCCAVANSDCVSCDWSLFRWSRQFRLIRLDRSRCKLRRHCWGFNVLSKGVFNSLRL